MAETSVEFELVVTHDRQLTVPAEHWERLAAVPGQRVRVRIDADVTEHRPLMGTLAKPGLTRLTLDDFDDVSGEVWGGLGYGPR